MKFLVRHDFTKSQPRWDANLKNLFGERNEGFVIEGDSAKDAIAKWNASRLPGDRLNPFYLEITPAREKNPVRGAPDVTAARELEIYINNDSELRHKQLEPILRNIARKMKKGAYDHEKAKKLWGYLVESGAKKYSKEFSDGKDWSRIFSAATRALVLQELADHYRDRIERGEFGTLDELARRPNPRRDPLHGNKARRVTIRGDKFKVARALADERIPFAFVKESQGYTTGDVNIQHLEKLSRFLESHPDFEGRFAKYVTKNPLKPGYSRKTVSGNIRREIKRGHSPKSSVAMALQKARDTFRKKFPGKKLPSHLKAKHIRSKNSVRPLKSFPFVVSCAKKKAGPFRKIAYFDTKNRALEYARSYARKYREFVKVEAQ